MTCSDRILSGVSQQLFVHVNTNTLPNSIGVGSLFTNCNLEISVDRTCNSHNKSLPQFWHFGIASDNGVINSGNVSREYLENSKYDRNLLSFK